MHESVFYDLAIVLTACHEILVNYGNGRRTCALFVALATIFAHIAIGFDDFASISLT